VIITSVSIFESSEASKRWLLSTAVHLFETGGHMANGDFFKGTWGGEINWKIPNPPLQIGNSFTLIVTSVTGNTFEGTFKNHSGQTLPTTDRVISGDTMTYTVVIVPKTDEWGFSGTKVPAQPPEKKIAGGVTRKGLLGNGDGDWTALSPPGPGDPGSTRKK
jgi:hypothetical protein